MDGDTTRTTQNEHRAELWHRAAFFGIAALMLILVVLVPFAVQSVVSNLLHPAEGQVYTLTVPTGESRTSFSRLHVAVAALDELRLRGPLRVSGHHDCRTPCDWSTQVVFFSLHTFEGASAGVPPSASVTLPPTGTSEHLITESIELPVSGHPSRYPFDDYELWLGVAVLRHSADGAVHPLTADEVQRRLHLAVQEQLPRAEMLAPERLDPTAFHDSDDVYQYAVIDVLRFTRPLHIKILAVLLVALIAAAATYAVFMRPLAELVVNAGGLVLGVWAIRAILSPSNPAYLTVVDLSLSLVILFLLGAITVRALQYAQARSGFHRRHQEHKSPDTKLASDTCDHPDCGNPIAYRCERCRQAYCPRHASAGPPAVCDACTGSAGRTDAPPAAREQPERAESSAAR